MRDDVMRDAVMRDDVMRDAVMRDAVMRDDVMRDDVMRDCAAERDLTGGGALTLSVIVPAHRNGALLRRSLAALRASDLPRDRWELIVADDASGDDTPTVAGAQADRVIRLEPPSRGPARARNRAAEQARGDLLVFLDADVCLHPDALRRFADAFAADQARAAGPALGAVFGVYDDAPPEPGLVSQYRNLVHRYVHLRGAGPAETFWAGCGAVRSEAFRAAGGFDEHRYTRPQIEDIELGHRLRDLGWRIELSPDIQGTHLKRWTLRSGIAADVRDRGVPWVRLLLADAARGRRASTLNIRPAERLYTALTVAAVVALALAAASGRTAWLVVAAACLMVVLGGNAGLLRWFARVRGVRFALAVVPLRLLYYLLNAVAIAVGGWLHLRQPPSVGPPGGTVLAGIAVASAPPDTHARS
ncbi:MAG: glycosyltransferase family 2 protein [Gemmatimonadaceae bacterium]